jgi:hypothetical protein
MKYSTRNKTKKNKNRSKRNRSKKNRSKRNRSKRNTYRSKKNKNKSSRKNINKHYKGGEIAVKPFEMLGFPHGASSDSEAALKIGNMKNQAQYEMNKIGGGRISRRGGGGEDEITKKTMEVPQFYPIGGIKTAYTSTGLSADGNLTSLIGAVDSTNDHFATAQAGGRRKKYRISRHNKRY